MGCLGMLLPGGAWARDIMVNVDMTPEGHKAVHPTPEHPAYYLPVVLGYQELGGDKAAGEHIPPDKDVMAQLASQLAAQGYLPSHVERSEPHHRSKDAERNPAAAAKLAPPPSLVVTFFWGSLNPVKMPNGQVVNQDRMMALVAGKAMDSLQPFSMRFEDVIQQGVEMDHYFIIVAAYDFQAYFGQRPPRKVLLWTARMSIPSAGLWLPQIVPALAKAGGPFFGRETTRPQWIHPPTGEVKAGTPEVKGYVMPAQASPAPAH